MPLYTATGDRGTTSLIDGSRVPKTHPRLEAYGTVDELAAQLGLLNAQIAFHQVPDTDDAQRELTAIGHLLFGLGAALATPSDEAVAARGIDDRAIEAIQHSIDRLDAENGRWQGFVVPGGSVPSAQAHVARTVCRRAERLMIGLQEQGIAVDATALRFVNRLSDYLFALSRYLVHRSAGAEVFYDPSARL